MALDQLLEPLEAHGWLGGAHAGPDLDPKEVRRHRRLRVAAPRIDDAGGGDLEAVHPHSKLFGQAPHGNGLASAQAGEDELQRCRTSVIAASARGLVGDEAVSTGPNRAPHSAFPPRLRVDLDQLGIAGMAGEHLCGAELWLVHGFAARLFVPITSFRLEPRSPSKTLAQLRPGRPDIDPPGWVQAPV